MKRNLNLLILVITSYFAAFNNAIAQDLYLDTSSASEITISSTEISNAQTIIIRDDTVAENAVNQEVAIATNSVTSANLPYQNEVVTAAQETKLDPALIHAVIAVESKHNAYARSNKGAYGLMQLMPETARRFGNIKKNSTMQNVLAGSRYLRELLGQFGGNLELALAAYNAGPAAVIKYQNQIPPYQETKLYVPKVLKYYRRFSA